MKKLNITFCGFPDYAGDAKALYEYMRKYNSKQNLIWAVYDEIVLERLKNKDIKTVLIGRQETEMESQKENDEKELITTKIENKRCLVKK